MSSVFSRKIRKHIHIGDSEITGNAVIAHRTFIAEWYYQYASFTLIALYPQINMGFLSYHSFIEFNTPLSLKPRIRNFQKDVLREIVRLLYRNQEFLHW